MIVKCKNCNKEFNKSPARIRRHPNHFCSLICSSDFSIGKKKNYPTVKPGPKPKVKASDLAKCLNCNNQVKRYNSPTCSPQCGTEYKQKKYIQSWQSGEIPGGNIYGISDYVRRYLFDKYNNQCSKCGWAEVNPISNKIPLEVEHIDGNWENCKENNLTVLCPNCHSLTSTYRSLNNGKGRYTVFKNMGKTPYGPGSGS